MRRIGEGKFYEVLSRETELEEAFLSGRMPHTVYARSRSDITAFWDSVAGVFDSAGGLSSALRTRGALTEADTNKVLEHELAHSGVILRYGLTPSYRMVVFGDSPQEERVVCSVGCVFPEAWTVEQRAAFYQDMLSAPADPSPNDRIRLETLADMPHST